MAQARQHLATLEHAQDVLDTHDPVALADVRVLGASVPLDGGPVVIEVAATSDAALVTAEAAFAEPVRWRQRVRPNEGEQVRCTLAGQEGAFVSCVYYSSPDMIPVRARASVLPDGVTLDLLFAVDPASDWIRHSLEAGLVTVRLPDAWAWSSGPRREAASLPRSGPLAHGARPA